MHHAQFHVDIPRLGRHSFREHLHASRVSYSNRVRENVAQNMAYMLFIKIDLMLAHMLRVQREFYSLFKRQRVGRFMRAVEEGSKVDAGPFGNVLHTAEISEQIRRDHLQVLSSTANDLSLLTLIIHGVVWQKLRSSQDRLQRIAKLMGYLQDKAAVLRDRIFGKAARFGNALLPNRDVDDDYCEAQDKHSAYKHKRHWLNEHRSSDFQ